MLKHYSRFPQCKPSQSNQVRHFGCPGLQDTTADVDFTELAWHGQRYGLQVLYFGLAGNVHRMYSSFDARSRGVVAPYGMVVCEEQSYRGCLLMYFSNQKVLVQVRAPLSAAVQP